MDKCALCNLSFHSHHQKYLYHETDDGNHKVGGFVSPKKVVMESCNTFAESVTRMLKRRYASNFGQSVPELKIGFS